MKNLKNLFHVKVKIKNNVDAKLFHLGFLKVSEEPNKVIYDRYDPDHHYVHRVVLSRELGSYYIHTFEKDGKANNKTLGLTLSELKLFTKKMRYMSLKGAMRNAKDR